ncbi:transcriptional regulator, partial [Rhizobium leguminosarum]
MTISGAGIRRIRLLRSMKQEHLAELLGVNQATYKKLVEMNFKPLEDGGT